MKTAKNYAGEKIGKLRVIRRLDNKIGGSGQQVVQWECACECGTIVVRRSHHLKRGGCRCKKCKAIEDAKKFGHGEIRQHHWYCIQNLAKKRRIEFAVSIQYIWDLYEEQKGLCALSGLPIGFAKTRVGHAKGETTASLDRIDSSKGYVLGNVQWLHKWVNLMKSDFTHEELLFYCKAIVEHNKWRN